MAGIQEPRGLVGRVLTSDSAPGLVLIASAALALALANSAWADAWHDLFHHPLGWSPIARLGTLHAWINDGLMALFFFVVGLEIKRELLVGALADRQRRRLPLIAALAGMALPALIYVGVVGANAALRQGWAIPAATDIAFAIGVLALAGRNLPSSVRLFLLTVAIVDDLGAIAVIAVFYTASLDYEYLAIGAAILMALAAMNRMGVRLIVPYLIGAVALWFAVLHSGIHATVAGVLAALTVPLALDRKGDSPLLRLEHALVAPNGFVVVPLFGLANAGVALGGIGGGSAFATLPLAIAAGLFVGKQGGILLAVLGCERLGIAARPAGTSLGHLWGMALLCGIGFTMSLFIAGLAFPSSPELVEEGKIGILAGSLLSAFGGALILRIASRPGRR